MTSTKTRSRASDYLVKLVKVSKFVIRESGLMNDLTRSNYLLGCLSRFGKLVDALG
jgi:hypothetical protein